MKTKQLLLFLIAGMILCITSCKKEKDSPVTFEPVHNYVGGMVQFSGLNKPVPFYIIFGPGNTAYLGTHIIIHTTTYTFVNDKLVVPYIGGIVFEFDMTDISKNGAINKFTSNKPDNIAIIKAFAEKMPAADMIKGKYFTGQIGNDPLASKIGIRFLTTTGPGGYDIYSMSTSFYNAPLPEPTSETGYYRVINKISFKADINGSGYFHFGVLFNNSLELIEYTSNAIGATATLKQKN